MSQGQAIAEGIQGTIRSNATHVWKCLLRTTWMRDVFLATRGGRRTGCLW